MIPEINRIAELQREYSSKNTPAMQERGKLVRQDLPDLLRKYLPLFNARIGRFAGDLKIEGSDGKGNKTEAPWVRLYSQSLSPSATSGFYVVIHFSVDGNSFFVTLGCGATKWNSERGMLIRDSDQELNKKVRWAKDLLRGSQRDFSIFPDQIAIGSTKDLPRSFEKATVLAKTLDPKATTEEELVSWIGHSLELLEVIYDSYSQRSDLPSSEVGALDLQAAISPNRAGASQRQGYGLSATERKAVELRAMDVAREKLEGLGYSITDTSANHPFDFLAESGEETIKVEVKGSTSSEMDSVLMTSNEVKLHRNEAGKTALAIVSGIKLTNRDQSPKATGGALELLLPWDISEWELTPKAFAVTRRANT